MYLFKKCADVIQLNYSLLADGALRGELNGGFTEGGGGGQHKTETARNFGQSRTCFEATYLHGEVEQLVEIDPTECELAEGALLSHLRHLLGSQSCLVRHDCSWCSTVQKGVYVRRDKESNIIKNTVLIKRCFKSCGEYRAKGGDERGRGDYISPAHQQGLSA